MPAAGALLFYVFMGGIAVAVAGFLDIDVLRPFAEVLEAPLPVQVALGAGMGLAVVALSHVLDRFFEWSRALTRSMRQALGPQSRGTVAILALSSSIGEELLFRGLLLPTSGLVVSSVIFGVVHGVSPGPAEHMWKMLRRFAPLVLIATAMGFAFALTVVYTGSLLAAIIAHFTINFLNLSAMFRDEWRGEQG